MICNQDTVKYTLYREEVNDTSDVNQTGKVNDPSLSNTVSCKRLHITVMESYVKYTKIV